MVYVVTAIVVAVVTVFNVKTVLEANRTYDLNLVTINMISYGENGETDGDVDGENASGGLMEFCYSGGKGSTACSIEAGTEIKGFGVSAGCSVSCENGYYACCSLRCVCHKKS